MLKKFIKFIVICSLSLFVIMSISRILSPIFWRLEVADVYKEEFDIEFETPEKFERIFTEGGRDLSYLNKLTYNEETYKKMIEYDYVLPMSQRDVEELLSKTNPRLSYKTENFEKLNSVINYIIKNKNNYYAYFEKPGYYAEIFLYDVENRVLYIWARTF